MEAAIGIGAGVGIAGVVALGVTTGGYLELRRRNINISSVARKVSQIVTELSVFSSCSNRIRTPQNTPETRLGPASINRISTGTYLDEFKKLREEREEINERLSEVEAILTHRSETKKQGENHESNQQ